MALFNAKADKPKLWRISEGEVSFGAGGEPAMALNVEISVNRQLSPIATIGHGIQWAAQPCTGNATFGTILMKSDTAISAFKADQDSCERTTITVKGNSSACEATEKELKIEDGYLSAITFTAAGQQGYIGQNLTVMFTTLTVK